MPRGSQQHTAPAPVILAAMPPSRHFAAMAILGVVCSLKYQNLSTDVQRAKFLAVSKFLLCPSLAKFLVPLASAADGT
jgi:hypothetical protein